MTERYPHSHSSMILDNDSAVCDKSSTNSSNRETSKSLSSQSSINRIEEQILFHDVDLNNCSDETSHRSDSPNNSGTYSWKLGADSVDILSDNNGSCSDSKILSSDSFTIPFFAKNAFNGSSISSLSSLTSAADLSLSFQSSPNCDNTTKANHDNTIDGKPSSTRISSSIDKTDLKTNFFSQITQFVNFTRSKSSPKSSSNETPLKSTTCLILNDRPRGLPPKSNEEIKRHQDEYNQLINNIKKKEKQQNHADKVRQKTKINQEERQYQLTNVWRNFILPNWFHQQTSQYVRHLWWEGIPTSVRDKVWKQCIPNTLKLTKTHYENFLSQMQERIERYLEPVSDPIPTSQKTGNTNGDSECNLRSKTVTSTAEARSSAYDLYISETVSIHSKRSSSHSFSANACSPHNKEPIKSTGPSSEVDIRQILLNTIKLDVSRTFPHLNLFQNGGPHHDLLYQLLGAYTCYRPDIGYVQGMSFLAAVLILVMNVDDAFICFANILELPCHHAFYALEETEFTVYLESFKRLLFTHLPQLAQHFTQHKLDVNIFLCDWLFTIYSRTLPLETALRVWDMFCRDGEAALFRAGLGILRCYEMQLLNSDFEEMAGFLTGQMPETLTASILVEEMREIKLNHSNFCATIDDVRSKLIKNKCNQN